MRKMTFAQATLEAMAEEMKKDDKVYVIGEDIARQGGVFGQFKGLGQEFPGRVIDSLKHSSSAAVSARLWSGHVL